MKCKMLIPIIILMMGIFMISAAQAGEAADISENCTFTSDTSARKAGRLTNGNYESYWQSGNRENPYLIITSEEPMHTLYLCFREMPESYEVQKKDGDKWATITEGDTRFHHVSYALGGEKEIRILSTAAGKHRLILNEVYVFGEGEAPGWVQHWEETEEKADLMLLVAHPDDELLFFAGFLPTYAAEMGRKVVVVYLTYADKTRRSEALDGLWTLGVKNYPVFGPFKDKYCTKIKDAYNSAKKDKVLAWVTELFRKYRPEVVLTHDLQGEYGHGQHKMMADACIQAYELAADADYHPKNSEPYSPWEVKKLYIHRYRDGESSLHFDWDVPLQSLGGKTGMEIAEEAFTKHVTQTGLSFSVGGYHKPLSVMVTGVYYENTDFGLYASRVGPDEALDDFMEHIEKAEEHE